MFVLVTGAAGFIGYHLIRELLANSYRVIAVDNLNSYYDPQLKLDRLSALRDDPNFSDKNFVFIRADVSEYNMMRFIFEQYKISSIIHLAAQAGVRYSIENPHVYAQTNLVGFTNILECARHYNVDHLVYASTSSLYGLNKKVPYEESDAVDHPSQFYAATKRANELMAHSYSHLFKLPTTGLRFFTVYGPWGRPDMAPYLFLQRMFSGEALNIYNYGNHLRDFTYVEDVAKSIFAVMKQPPEASESDARAVHKSSAPFAIYNVGSESPVSIIDFVQKLEKHAKLVAKKEFYPLQPGDLVATHASSRRLYKKINYKPTTDLETGVGKFVRWYTSYHPRSLSSSSSNLVSEIRP